MTPDRRQIIMDTVEVRDSAYYVRPLTKIGIVRAIHIESDERVLDESVYTLETTLAETLYVTTGKLARTLPMPGRRSNPNVLSLAMLDGMALLVSSPDVYLKIHFPIVDRRICARIFLEFDVIPPPAPARSEDTCAQTSKNLSRDHINDCSEYYRGKADAFAYVARELS